MLAIGREKEGLIRLHIDHIQNGPISESSRVGILSYR